MEILFELIRNQSLVLLQKKDLNFSERTAISASVFPEEETHIEVVRYGKGSDAMNALAAPVLVDGGGKIPRQLKCIWEFIKHPFNALRMLIPFGFAKRSIILLVMQSIDNYIRIVHTRRTIFPFKKILSSKVEKGVEIPTYIPIANQFARNLAKEVNGIARSSINEVLLDIPMTAHILGGACIGENPLEGVINTKTQLFHYQNFYICDGSMIPANLGVNPSLNIVAFSERAMSYVPPKRDDKIHFFKFEESWQTKHLLLKYKQN